MREYSCYYTKQKVLKKCENRYDNRDNYCFKKRLLKMQTFKKGVF